MEVIIGWHGGEIRAFTEGVEFEFEAQKQAHQIAGLPFVHRHVAIMPDVHAGIGATVGSVIPTKGAIVPASVGVDLGCGMMATRLSLKASHLPDNLSQIRSDIERTVPHGGPGPAGGWQQNIPTSITKAWVDKGLERRFKALCDKHPEFAKANALVHLGTLGGGNHFIELCIDEEQRVWLMLHSGSRGIGNKIGRYKGLVKDGKTTKKLTVYKKVYEETTWANIIATLEIPKGTRVVLNPEGDHKCRAEKVKVVKLEYQFKAEHNRGAVPKVAVSSHDNEYTYKVGETKVPDEEFDDTPDESCASGIHFFIDREDAESY